MPGEQRSGGPPEHAYLDEDRSSRTVPLAQIYHNRPELVHRDFKPNDCSRSYAASFERNLSVNDGDDPLRGPALNHRPRN